MIQLAERNLKPKDTIVDWQQMPAQACELNFRPPGTAWARVWLTGFLLKRSALGVALVGLLLVSHRWVARFSPIFVVVLGGLVAGSRAYRFRRLNESRALSRAILIVIAFPLVWVLTVLLMEQPLTLVVRTAFVVLILPATCLLADKVAKNAVWWATASPRVSHQMMSLGRLMWSDRFGARVKLKQLSLSAEARKLLLGVRPGIAYVLRLAAVALLSLYALRMSGRRYVAGVGPATPLLLLLSQLPVSAWVLMRHDCAVREFLLAFKHWCFWELDRFYPPTVFRSPCRRASQRRWTVSWLLVVVTAAIVIVAFFSGPEPLAVRFEAACRSGFSGALTSMLYVTATCLVLPPVLILTWLFNITAPTIVAYVNAFESSTSPLIAPEWTSFDGYTDRLKQSSNALERRCQYVGYHPTSHTPVLIDDKLNFEHKLVLGASGVGKTALGLIGQLTQLIRRRDGAAIIVDCKGDRALFNTARIEAERAGATFKWFTNKPNHSTYVFNPFNQGQLHGLTMHQIVGLFMMSLNLHHGDDYGRAWFSISSRMLFQEALRELQKRSTAGRPFSFGELERVIYQLAADQKEFKAAQHLAFIVANLGQFEQLNLSPSTAPNHAAVQNAIHMPEVIAEKQVVYFSLVGATDIASVGEIARLALYSAVSAAIDHRDRTGRRPRLYFMIDEAQVVVAKNIQNVLAQARDFGLACTLSLQTLSQLNPPGGTDLRELILNCTTVKQFFSAREPATQEYISKVSGEVGYHKLSWPQFAHRVAEGDVGPHRAVHYVGEEPEVQVSSETGPRLTVEDINDVSRHPNRSIMSVARTSGYSSYVGAFPVHSDWAVPEAEYDRRSFEMPWPETSDETIEIAPFWPESNAHTIVPGGHPPLENPAVGIAADRLAEVRRRLEQQDSGT